MSEEILLSLVKIEENSLSMKEPDENMGDDWENLEEEDQEAGRNKDKPARRITTQRLVKKLKDTIYTVGRRGRRR
jgi:hypothetical protein